MQGTINGSKQGKKVRVFKLSASEIYPSLGETKQIIKIFI